VAVEVRLTMEGSAELQLVTLEVRRWEDKGFAAAKQAYGGAPLACCVQRRGELIRLCGLRG
jgi:hypothetical protein